MVTKAVARYIRISPRKFRLIIPLVKGKNPEAAIAILMNVKKGACVYAIELLKSAIANAKRKQGVDVSNLYISRFFADCGPTLKRFRAASMGRASTIRKRTSHITVELDEFTNKKENKRVEAAHAGTRAHKEDAQYAVKAKEKDKAKDAAAHAKPHKARETKKAESGKKGKE